MTRYRFVEAESSRYAVTQPCRIAPVSRTAYYASGRTDTSDRAMIRAIHAASGGQYVCRACWPSCGRRATTSAASAWRG
jgi:hypothetical protein